MKKKLKNILYKWSPIYLIGLLVIIWQIVSMLNIVPSFMLPSPIKVINAFVKDFPCLMKNLAFTLAEAFIGLIVSILLSFILAILMDKFNFLNKSIYPVLVISQTIPAVALAPLLVLWLGYGMLPKIVLVVLLCFFPITVALLESFKSVDKDIINLMNLMGASKWQILKYVKLPASIDNFFSGLKISVSYSIVGAVVSEWLGGNLGLGVYMTLVRKSYAFDKMFAVIILIALISLILVYIVKIIKRLSMPWVKN